MNREKMIENQGIRRKMKMGLKNLRVETTQNINMKNGRNVKTGDVKGGLNLGLGDMRRGFTILELIIVATVAGLLFLLFFVQKNNLDAFQRDEDRKTAINAMYYALEESYYKDHKYYPETISEENITVIDPALWTDPDGYNLGDPKSSYSYEPADCDNGRCKKYTLKTDLEKEATYVKTNRN